MYQHYLSFGSVIAMAALCLGATRAEYETKDSDHRLFRHAPDLTTDLKRELHRPLILPKYPTLVNVRKDFSSEQLRHRRSVIDSEDMDHKVRRSVKHSSFPRPRPNPQPSPTFPKPPKTSRFRRETEGDEEPFTHDVFVTRPSKYQSPEPALSPTFPQPEDIHRPVLARFRRGGGRVSVDVDKSRGSKSTTTVTAERNVYKSGDGRTRVDAGGYANNRGDRGGRINFSHRF